MRLLDGILLVVLAAIWGTSFIFMRVLAPVLGPQITATSRTLIAGGVLVAAFAASGMKLNWRKEFRHYLVIGLLNSAIPALLFSYAALHVAASISSIINALTPLWGSIFAALLLGERLTGGKVTGIILGLTGVSVITLFGTSAGSLHAALLPVLACAGATMCYGVAGTYAKRWAGHIPSRAMTAVSLLFAGIALLPFSLLDPPKLSTVAPTVWLLAVAFSLLCSAIAYLIFFRLIATSGVTFTLSVTLLIPVFAIVWGFLFLGERVRPAAFLGASLVLGGTTIIGRANRSRSRRAPQPNVTEAGTVKEPSTR